MSSSDSFFVCFCGDIWRHNNIDKIHIDTRTHTHMHAHTDTCTQTQLLIHKHTHTHTHTHTQTDTQLLIHKHWLGCFPQREIEKCIHAMLIWCSRPGEAGHRWQGFSMTSESPSVTPPYLYRPRPIKVHTARLGAQFRASILPQCFRRYIASIVFVYKKVFWTLGKHLMKLHGMTSTIQEKTQVLLLVTDR